MSRGERRCAKRADKGDPHDLSHERRLSPLILRDECVLSSCRRRRGGVGLVNAAIAGPCHYTAYRPGRFNPEAWRKRHATKFYVAGVVLSVGESCRAVGGRRAVGWWLSARATTHGSRGDAE